MKFRQLFVAVSAFLLFLCCGISVNAATSYNPQNTYLTNTNLERVSENTYSYSFKMTTSEPLSGTFIIALYDDKNFIEYFTEELTDAVTEYISADKIITSDTVPTKYKIFFWNNSEDLFPLCDSVGGIVYDKFDDVIIMSLNSNKTNKNGEIYDVSVYPKVDKNETILPLKAVSEIVGGDVEWSEEENKANFKFNNIVAEIPADTDTFKVNGESVKMNVKSRVIDGNIYVGSDFIEKLYNCTVTISDSGGIALADDEVADSEIKDIVWDMVYARPTKAQILKSFNETGNKSHPRLLFDADRLEEIKDNITNDALCSQNYNEVKLKAEQMLNKPSVAYEIDPNDISLDNTMNASVREVADIVRYCAFVYLIEGDEEYAARAVKELENAASFPNWCPSHFLDTAEMTQCMALGYDWLYDYLCEQGKAEIIEKAIVDKGLEAANEAYNGTAVYSDEQGAAHNRMMWKEDYSNWGFVCNGGIASGAFAIMNDSNAEYCADIISKAFASTAYPMSVFAPDGAWTEGIGYWTYGVEYMIYLIDGAMYTLGTDYDATEVPGFDTTPIYFATHLGPQGAFNYGDAGSNYSSTGSWLWFGKKLNDPSLISLRLNDLRAATSKDSINDLIYYTNVSADEAQIPKDSYYRGSETAVFRSGSGNGYENYIAVRGTNAGLHNDLDAGSFVLDAVGVRWAMDFGMEKYSVPNYWFWPGRGDYYRKRAEGHNTLVIEPDSGLDQVVGGEVKVDAFRSGESGGYTVLDITECYSHKAKSVKRAVGIFDNRSRFIVQDSIVCDEPSDIWWLMQTKANIEISKDGKMAILSSGDRLMLIQLISNCKGAVLTYGPAQPFSTSPHPALQSTNDGVRRLAVKSPEVTELNMQMIFTPYVVGEIPILAEIPFKSIEDFAAGNVIDVD